MTTVFPHDLEIAFSGAPPLPNKLGLPFFDLDTSVFQFDSDGAGTLIPALPEHTLDGAHGPKVTITQTGADNALSIIQAFNASAVSVTASGTGSGRGLEITSASNIRESIKVNHNGNSTDAVLIDCGGTARALHTEDGDVLFNDGDVAIPNGELRVNTDRLFVGPVNVGIGTTTPDTNRLLDVNGGAAFRGNHLFLTNPAAPGGQRAWGFVINTADGSFSLGPTSDALPAGGSLTELPFVIEANQALSAVMRITSEGTIGVGTTSPGAKVEIEQNAGGSASGLLVDHNSGSGAALQIVNDGTGHSFLINHDSPEEAVLIQQVDPSGSDAVQIDNFGAEDGIFIRNLQNTAHSAVDARSVGSGPVIHIHSSGSGRDIEGTDANWNVNKDGNAHFSGVRYDGSSVYSRTVWGRVTSAGTIEHAGSGDWTVNRLGLGNYEITFTTSFADDPVIQVTVRNSSARGCQVSSFPTTTTAQVFPTAGSSASDEDFMFIAIGAAS